MDTDFIVWVQQFSNPFFDAFFVFMTTIGNPETYIIALPLVYWCINKRETFRFGLFLLISAYVNVLLKTIANVARPSGDTIRVLYEESTGGTPSFPSGHAQGAASFWGYIFYYFNNKIVRIAAVLFIIFIGLSRIYLGVHFPIDVLVGIMVGIVLLIIYNLLYESVVKRLKKLPFIVKMLLSIGVPLILLVLPGYDKGMILGFAAGMVAGYQLEIHYLQFSVKASLGKQILKYIIGISGLGILEFGGGALLSGQGFWNGLPLGLEFIKYLLIGLWAFFIGPWLFIQLGLSKKLKTGK